MSGTRQGTHERSSLSDVQSKSNEDQKTGTDLRTCPPASDERERYGGVDRLPVLLLVEVKKSSIRTSKKKEKHPRTETSGVCFLVQSVGQKLLQRET